MLRSKKDVDRHVRDILNKVRTEEERKVRGYNIARMYYNVGEYESARRYLSEFLSVRPKANDAHRLLGQIFESLILKEKAVQAYKTAYELGEGQRDLVLKICELYCDVPCDASVRLYWADEGDRLFPHHENVIRLREAIISTSTSSREELEKLYFDEIKANPLRVKLYTSLLQLYKDWKGKEKEAYKYGFQIEARKAFPDSLEWYQALSDSSEVYRNIADVDDDVEFHRNYLSVLERLVYLTLASSSSTALLSQCTHMDASTLLHKFDQALMTSLKIVGEDQVFGKLMVGQLYMHMASVLLHSSKKESLLQTNTSAGALLFHACRFRPSEGGHPSKSQTSQEQFWYKLACHRLSQAYHVLHHMAKTEGEKSQFLETIKQKISNTEAQANIFTTIFGSSYSNTMESSFFMNDDKFYTAVLAYPEPEQVKKWDSVVGSMYCSSLRDMVWLCMQQAPSNLKEPQPYYSFALFEGLQFSSNKINTGAAETLCHLDLLAFLVATVFCQKAASKDAHVTVYTRVTCDLAYHATPKFSPINSGFVMYLMYHASSFLSPEHTKNMGSWKELESRIEKGQTIDKVELALINNEQRRWREVLTSKELFRCKVVDPKKHVDTTLKSWADTRWESRINSVEVVRFQAAKVRDALLEVRGSTADPAIKIEAQALAEEVGSYRFSICTVVWYDILKKVQTVNKLLQSQCMQLDVAVDFLKKAETSIVSYRDTGFADAQTSAKEICEEMNVEAALKQKRLRTTKTGSFPMRP
ncbi:RANBP2-like and GRIP domain-containing protein 5/6 [Macrobrachium nipponense]|uniref:RANBP2-like and GRIP domain-containing protein 5/6 n=1 Tax=Macrobrachium nipponense TaxID=159736 RepID=UPI0030C875C5